MLVDWLQEHGDPNLPADLLNVLERWEAAQLTPSQWNQKFLPDYFGRFPPADFHQVLDADLHNLHTRRGSKRSYIAPRGGAKSTWCTLAYPLRAALEKWEPYTIILSDSSEQAVELLRHIKTEIATNPAIAAVYPDAAGVGPEWKENRIRLRNGAVIEALGSGKKIRGRRNRSARPSLVIFDDVQSNEDVVSPTLRARAWDWATREVMPVGDERTNFLAVGSALHPESVAVRLNTDTPGWVGRTFPAIHSWPDRMDLWDEFVRIACASAAENRLELADTFFRDRAEEMVRGARTYWPERWSLAALMLKRAEIGASAFQSEYQGVPSVAQGAEFPVELFPGEIWFDHFPTAGMVVVVQALDPSKGKDGKGRDYQAHVTIVVTIEAGRYVYWIDADLQREGVVQMCDRTVALAKLFFLHTQRAVDSVLIEDNATMGLLPPAIDAACVKAQYPIPCICRPSSGEKEWRIRAQVGPPLSRRQLRFRRTPGGRMLVSQLQGFPMDEFDDGPDALATALKRVAELLAGVK